MTNAKRDGTTVDDGRKRKRLLLVDPDPLLRWSIETHLHAWYDVEAAAVASDAMERLRNTGFDAMILRADIGAVIEELESAARSRNEMVKIIRLTTGGECPTADVSVVCLEKPFRLETLALILGVPASRKRRNRDVR